MKRPARAPIPGTVARLHHALAPKNGHATGHGGAPRRLVCPGRFPSHLDALPGGQTHVTNRPRRPIRRPVPRPVRRAVRAALLAATCALPAACTTDVLGVGGSSELLAPVPVLQPADEPITVDNRRYQTRDTKLGAQQHPAILRAYGGVYPDPKLERTVARVVGRLTAATPDQGETYRVTLLDSPSVNAFALPGGYLYVTRGLLALADDSAELAAVLAHEMAHVIADHGLARARREEATTVAARVAGRVMSSAEARIALARDKVDAASFSRQQELEADQIGTVMMARAGFDPDAAVSFLDSMEAYTRYRAGGEDADRLDFLASHPAAPQRLSKLRSLAASLKGQATARERERYLSGIDGMVFGDAAANGFVRGDAYVHPALGVRFRVPDGYELENASDAVLATGPGDVALRFDGVAAEGRDPVAYLRSGWVAGLDEASVRPLTIGGLPGAVARARAGQYAFDVRVVRVDDRIYRFLTAAPPGIADLPGRAAAIASTFERLDEAARDAIGPLRLAVRAGAGADAMRGVERAGALYEVLNAGAPDGLRKVVTE